MKKSFMFFCIVIMFLGFVGCPSPNDPAPRAATSSVAAKPSVGVDTSNGDNAFHVSEPITLVMLGSGLVSLAVMGRKRFKK